jgi:hypothetical protein
LLSTEGLEALRHALARRLEAEDADETDDSEADGGTAAA